MAKSGSNLKSYASNFTSIYGGYTEEMAEKTEQRNSIKFKDFTKILFKQIILKVVYATK